MSSARAKIIVAVVTVVGAIVVAIIQRERPIAPERQPTPAPVISPQIHMSPQIVVSPQIQLTPQPTSVQTTPAIAGEVAASSPAMPRTSRAKEQKRGTVLNQPSAPIVSPTNRGWPDYAPVTPIEKVE